MIKNSKNIFIILFLGIWNFFKISLFSLFSLLFFKKMNIIEKKFPFLDEILQKWPNRFWEFPTAVRLGRAIFAPILFLFSQKNDTEKSSKK